MIFLPRPSGNKKLMNFNVLISTFGFNFCMQLRKNLQSKVPQYIFSLPIDTGNLLQLQFPFTKTCYFHYHNFGTLIISRFDEFPHEVVIMLFFSIAAAVLLHKRKKKEEGFKSANITSLRFSFQGFVVLARRDMDKSTSLRGELVWFGLHNVILPSNPTYPGAQLTEISV